MTARLIALIGLLNATNEVLISLRKDRSQYNGYWEYPGGKVDEGETVDQALIREAKEELNIDISAECVAPLTFAVDSNNMYQTILLLYVCRKWDGTPTSLISQELEWVKPINLVNYDMPPPNVFLNSMLRDWIADN